MTGFKLPGFPIELQLMKLPLERKVGPENSLTILAGEKTDLFIDPAGNYSKDSAPGVLFIPPDDNFVLSAKVTVNFVSEFDAGGLLAIEASNLWAKLCLEYSLQQEPSIVSVVTRGLSDDCNSVTIANREVYLRIACTTQTIAFHYSRDSQYWHLVRYFTLGKLSNLKVGFLSQSPTGKSCFVRISEISYWQGVLKDNRNGE